MGEGSNKSLFVGNLDHSVELRDLEHLFSKKGFKVEKVDLKSGFAFVFLEDGAAEAAEALDGREFGRSNRRLKVEIARGDGSIKKREDERRRTTETEPNESLFVVNFDPHRVTERDLERAFENYGKIVRVQKINNFAFIQFEDTEQAAEARTAMHGQKLGEREITVEFVDKKGGYGLIRHFACGS